ncbi:hypothetical protein Agabi119p4_5951 [Agaricus bisporus var. burnettii]|uniref:C2H2-type domain-containing protein n=1 Tax=Agaricus bisporus var. burnettii TaxID=192524 RepID=A0A8H7F0W6_AGABI|nr:hypothetical protein Agabi119p4_5951 [Agaricus bisporus var. burnettii]
MPFLSSPPWRRDPFSLFPSINPAYGQPLVLNDSQETQPTPAFKDLDDQIFGRNTYCPTPASDADVVVAPPLYNSSDLPQSSLLCPEPEHFWLAGIDNAVSPVEHSYPHCEVPSIYSTDPYRIEPLFDDEGDCHIQVLDVLSRESSLEIPLADLRSALFNAHKTSSYYLQAPSPPSPLSPFASSLPSPASSVQSFSDKSEISSPTSPGIHPPLTPSRKSECSSPTFLGAPHPLSPSAKNECPSPLPPNIDLPLSLSHRQSSSRSSSSPSLSKTSQMRHFRIRSQVSSPPNSTSPRILPYSGDLPANPEFPMAQIMRETDMRKIVSILQATITFGDWDFATRGLPPLEKEAVSTKKTRQCGEGRRSRAPRAEIQCLIPGCGANLTALHNFKSHISSHYGVHDWLCGSCNNSFSHSSSLARHKKEFCSAGKRRRLSQKHNSKSSNHQTK